MHMYTILTAGTKWNMTTYTLSRDVTQGPYSLTFLFLEKEFFLELENFLI